MRKIIMMKGLPGSGKSTWAKNHLDSNPEKFKRVSKDDLRGMLDNSVWSRTNEKFILKVRDYLIREALLNNFGVIIDDTNLEPKHEESFRKIAEELKIDFEVKDFTHIPLEICISNDLKRLASVGKDVIVDMYRRYLAPDPIKQPRYNPELPDCWIFDVDGTLALMDGRGPYEWKKVKEDKVNEIVKYIYSLIHKNKVKTSRLFIFSGRDGSCFEETQEWLTEHDIEHDGLFMRPAGNMEKDSNIKKNMYLEHIEGKYNVLGIFDDRNQVVEMWRSLGLPCFQVADGNF